MTNISIPKVIQMISISGVILMMAIGCHSMPDASIDQLSLRPPVTTPSLIASRNASTSTSSDTTRSFHPVQVQARPDAVKHFPLYFETPLEDVSDKDDSFAWTQEDSVHLIYGPCRFLVNTVLYPVSVLVNPPWQSMESDGRPSRKIAGDWHDAKVASTPITQRVENDALENQNSKTKTTAYLNP